MNRIREEEDPNQMRDLATKLRGDYVLNQYLPGIEKQQSELAEVAMDFLTRAMIGP